MLEWNKMIDHQKYLWRKTHKLNRHCFHCGKPIGDQNTTDYCHICRLKYNNSAWSLKTKKKISDSMKKAHIDGRAYTIGNNDRKQNVFSRPEKWLNDVLLNNKIKSFSHEIRVGKYFLDFCDVLTKCCIEMDGEQHTRYPQKLRDIEKDDYLKKNGYNLVRISWKDCYENSKEMANEIVQFAKTKNSEKLNKRYIEYNQNKLNNIVYDSFSDIEFSILDLINNSSTGEFIHK